MVLVVEENDDNVSILLILYIAVKGNVIVAISNQTANKESVTQPGLSLGGTDSDRFEYSGVHPPHQRHGPRHDLLPLVLGLSREESRWAQFQNSLISSHR